MKEKKPRKLNNHQILIKNLVTVSFSMHKTFWGNEMRIAGQLLKKYKPEFLLWLKPPNDYKVTSLVWFLTPEGKHYLSDQLVEYTKISVSQQKKEEIALSENKIGEDVVITKKPMTMQDFLKKTKLNIIDITQEQADQMIQESLEKGQVVKELKDGKVREVYLNSPR